MLASSSVHLAAMVMHWTKNERQRILLKEEQECVLLPWNMGRVAYLGARNRKIACVGMVARIGLETIQEEHRGITIEVTGLARFLREVRVDREVMPLVTTEKEK